MTDLPPLDSAVLLKRHGLQAKKRLGQNFLQDPRALEEIIAAAGIEAQDTVLEIGAGLGSLTRYLAQAAAHVLAVELDRRLVPVLQKVLLPLRNVDLVIGDILKLDLRQYGLPPGYLVAANIPYNITSAIIRRLLEADSKPRRMVLTIQKEVAERICAHPPDMSLLALSVQVYGKPGIFARIPAESFYPVPRVDSAILQIEPHPKPRIDEPHLDPFFRLIRAGFSQKRKTLRNALAAGLRLPPGRAEDLLKQAGIDPVRRAETLSLEEWGKLSALELKPR